MLAFGPEINKMLIRKANREDPDQVWSGSAQFVLAFLAGN